MKLQVVQVKAVGDLTAPGPRLQRVLAINGPHRVEFDSPMPHQIGDVVDVQVGAPVRRFDTGCS